MSYDIYFYKSKRSTPNLKEAETFVNFENEVSSDETEKNKIIACLNNFDPNLEQFKFDYNEIAKLQNITVDEAKNKFKTVELNSPEGDPLPFQFNIENESLTISVPYWYSEQEKINQLFLKMKEYLQSIDSCVGWHVYDPQTEQASFAKDFDFEKTKEAYLKGVGIIAEKIAETKKKSSNHKTQIITILVIIGLALLRVLLNK